IWDFIVFHVNVFVRVSDIKTLKHRQVEVVKNDIARFLAITPTRSKTVIRESVSMPTAVDVYERLLQRHKANGFGDSDDYVFFPQYRNREYSGGSSG
ncbi:MAG: hypothetical protein ACR2OR_11535, partial [Hyphomicrobiales bacterium]